MVLRKGLKGVEESLVLKVVEGEGEVKKGANTGKKREVKVVNASPVLKGEEGEGEGVIVWDIPVVIKNNTKTL